MSREGLMSEIRCLLRRTLDSRFDGDLHRNKQQVQAYADGYMRALLDAGLVDRQQLLSVIGEERRRFVERPAA